MNQFINDVIEEAFKSKKQQRLFFAKANDESLPKKERKKWKKWSKEFADKTNFKKLPEKAPKKDVDEIVDEDGNISRSSRPSDLSSKGVTSSLTTDQAVHSQMPQQGTFGIAGADINRSTTNTLKYWTEADMSKALGYEDTLGQDQDYDDAEEHFENELGLSDEETKERMEKMGYDEKLPDGKVRLVENPKKFIEEYIDNLLLSKKTKDSEIVEKDRITSKEINPIIIKQLSRLKEVLDDNGLTLNDVLPYLKENK